MIKKSVFIFVVVMVSVGWMGLWAQEPMEVDSGLGSHFKAGQRLRVSALSGLNLRAKPGVRARTLTIIPYGEEVEVVHTLNGKAPFRDDWVQGLWLSVRCGNRQGFVFDGYLTDLPLPRQGDEQLNCGAGQDYASLLQRYVNLYFTTVGEPQKRVVDPGPGESIHEQTIRELAGGHLFVFNQYWEGYSAELTLKGIRLMDAYNLVGALIHACPNRRAVLDDLVFVKDRSGDIHKIHSRFESLITIRQGGGEVKLIMNFPCC
jgi:hypothetical protein